MSIVQIHFRTWSLLAVGLTLALFGSFCVFRTATANEIISSIAVEHFAGSNAYTLTITQSSDTVQRVEVYSFDENATSSWMDILRPWSLAATNLAFVGTNPITWMDVGQMGRAHPDAMIGSRFYVIGNADVDNDADGLPDARERLVTFTDAFDADTDGDGLVDSQEIAHGTDPKNEDSDADTMLDGWEVQYGLDPLSADQNVNGISDQYDDFDYDGLTNDQEVVHWADPLQPDTDADLLSDGDEVLIHGTDPAHQYSDADALTDGDEVIIYETDPLVEDTDSDGLSDSVEALLTYQTDVLIPDTDSDGLTDGDEVNVYGTKPYSTDTDADGLPDFWEVQVGLSPINADQDTNSTMDACDDFDGDRLSNQVELDRGSHPLQWSDEDSDGLPDEWEQYFVEQDPADTLTNIVSFLPEDDEDGDGLSNTQELTQATNPIEPDSDYDGLTDGQEVLTHFTDPLNMDSDADLMPDGWEHQFGFDPLESDEDKNGTLDGYDDADADRVQNQEEYELGSHPRQSADTDSDGLPDEWERKWTGSISSLTSAGDFDADGLDDVEEWSYNTDPTFTDGDGDGVSDADELGVSSEVLTASLSAASAVSDPMDRYNGGVPQINLHTRTIACSMSKSGFPSFASPERKFLRERTYDYIAAGINVTWGWEPCGGVCVLAAAGSLNKQLSTGSEITLNSDGSYGEQFDRCYGGSLKMQHRQFNYLDNESLSGSYDSYTFSTNVNGSGSCSTTGSFTGERFAPVMWGYGPYSATAESLTVRREARDILAWIYLPVGVPCGSPGGLASIVSVLSDEYTTDELVQYVLANLPPWSEAQTNTSESASKLLSPDETSFSIQKLRYQLRFGLTPQEFTITWNEVFTPADGSSRVTRFKTWKHHRDSSATNTPRYEIDPYTWHGPTSHIPDGTYTIEDILVPRIDIAMDGNRDGAIDFMGSSDESYVFWVNDDIDVVSGGEEDDVESGTANADDSVISSKRDLEDFTRLHLYIDSNLSASTDVTFSLRFESGSPEINLFEAVDPSLEYLLQESVANAQLLRTKLYTVGNSWVPIDPVITSPSNQTSCFLIEGKRAGSGSLVFIAERHGIEIARQSIDLSLKPISEFYEKYVATITSEDEVTLTSMAVGTSTYVPENDEYVLFVHGWNLEEWLKDRWTETMFKRLWWQQYRGRVGSFQWPTLGLFFYDRSEIRAWNSASALRDRISILDASYPGQVRVLAHSMGNVVIGEALRQSTTAVVHTYIAAQPALPAHSYDQTIADYWTGFDTPNVYGFYDSGIAPDTPYFFGNTAKVGNLILYFNQVDYALGAWKINNELKPDLNYHYAEGDDNVDTYEPIMGDRFYYDSLLPLDERDLTFPINRYEIFARCAESRSEALGRENLVAGFDYCKNLELLGYDSQHYSHSRQFRSNIIDERGFWTAVRLDCGLTQ